LLGSRGALPAWNDRALSDGHFAIPLLSKVLVEGAPMIAQLLADLEVDLGCLDDGRPIASRRMLGSSNQCFYVSNAREARDNHGRFIIPSQDFVAKHAIDTVFGMAGSYLDGTIVVAISFTSESLDKLTVDPLPEHHRSLQRWRRAILGHARSRLQLAPRPLAWGESAGAQWLLGCHPSPPAAAHRARGLRAALAA